MDNLMSNNAHLIFMYHEVCINMYYVSLCMFREKLYCIILIILTILNYIFYTTCVTSNAFVTHYFFKDRFFGQIAVDFS